MWLLLLDCPVSKNLQIGRYWEGFWSTTKAQSFDSMDCFLKSHKKVMGFVKY